jgi:hypothetical protein
VFVAWGGETYIVFIYAEKRRELRTHRPGWEDNIKIDLEDFALEGVDWVHLARDRDR